MTQTNMAFDGDEENSEANWSTSDIRTYLNSETSGNYLNTRSYIANLAQSKTLKTAWKGNDSVVESSDKIFLLGYKDGQTTGKYSTQNFCIEDYLTIDSSSEVLRFASNYFRLRSGYSIGTVLTYAFGVTGQVAPAPAYAEMDNRPAFVLNLG